jgi:hypothetical protein
MSGKITHGHAFRNKKSKTYITWRAMRSRCQNPNDAEYKNYGARGVVVCKQWAKFENFLIDMGEAPAGLTIDRIDTNAGYCKANCTWSTRKEQATNQRRRFITHNGETLRFAEWEKRLGLAHNSISMRLWYGWSVERAVTEPKNKPFQNGRGRFVSNPVKV